MKNREEIKNILEMNIDDKAKIEEIANIKNTETEISRLIIMTEEEINNLKLNQKISQLGHSWKDINDKNASNISYQAESVKQGIEVYFNCSQAQGYKVEYLNESHFLELTDYDYERTDELLEEVENDTIYQDLIKLLGSDSEMQNECEILISNNTEFTVKEIIKDEEQNCYFVKLEK